MEETEKPQHKLPSQEIDYFKIGKILLSRWYWIIGSVVICTLSANVYLWYTPKTYATAGTLKLEEKKSELPDLPGGIVTGNSNNTSRVQSETIVLQSSALLLSAIKKLDYRISFFIRGRVLNRTNDVYPQKPIDVQLVKFDSLNFFRGLVTFRPMNKSSFSVSYKVGGKDVIYNYKYSVPFTIGPTSYSILNPGNLTPESSYLFQINAPENFIGRVRSGFHTNEIGKNSNIISLQEADANPQFAADILNAIMTEYLDYDRRQRTISASHQIEFIDSQLDFLSNEVKGSANSIEQYKQSKKIIDVTSATDMITAKAKDIGSQITLLNIELIAINQLQDEIVKEKENLSLDFNIGGADQDKLGDFITGLNSLILERNSMLKTYNEDAEPVRDVNKQILALKNNALYGVRQARILIQNKINYLNDQLKPIDEAFLQLPADERDMGALTRKFDINDKVYSFLSEKKLDAQISSAGIMPGATIIDQAQPNFSPVSPDENSIRRTALIFGLALGLGAIILIRVLNPYIYDKETIESLTAIPIIGVIRKYPGEIDEYSSQILAISRPRSIFAESVRSVRTNLSFLAAGEKTKIICITSEVAGEGKSFVAVNLSSTLSLIDKKVILVAADLRRSKLHKTFDVPNDLGLSNYLANQCEEGDIVMKSSQVNLDFIISGPVPPNPSELLHNSRMLELIESLKIRYDVIMIDTAPIGLVSDAIPLIRISDVNLFVIRSGKSKYYAATVPQRIRHEYHVDNTVIVLNAYAEDLLHSRYYTTKFTGENYGSRYYYYSDYSGYEGSGYYLDEKKKKWWDIRRWFNR